VAARAQSKVRIIGYLGSGSMSAQGPWIAAFVHRMRELGWIEGATLAVEYRWAEGHSERYDEIAAEFVRLRVDVILTEGVAVHAALRATTTTPIVFAVAGDPVGAGLVASLARPGGNVTGLSIQQPELAGKRLELLREVVPGLRQLAVLANIGSNNVVLEMADVQTAARARPRNYMDGN
jgi:putative tryptophan/tyrosine transport system substrate-binding protein